MKGYKTVLFSLLVGILGLLEALDWVAIIPDKIEPWVLPAVSGVFLYLRSITTTAIGKQS